MNKIGKAAHALAVALSAARAGVSDAIYSELSRMAISEAIAAASQVPIGMQAQVIERSCKQSSAYRLNLGQLKIESTTLAAACESKPLAKASERRQGAMPRRAARTLAEMAAQDFAKIVGQRPERSKGGIRHNKIGFPAFLKRLSVEIGITVSDALVQEAVHNWGSRHPAAV
jgi:hypothetical protein